MSIAPTAFFSALANDTRLRMLMLLLREGELCVCELTQAIGVSQPHVSRHLAQLRELSLVADRRAGTWIYYRIHPDLPGWACAVMRETAAGLAGATPFREDAKALAAMANRPGAPRCGGVLDQQAPELTRGRL
ncbi:metalloregulator ArsR/SmtB family transcription factor [Thiorhodovibrio frisius]|uniref:Putative transcriptional regulator n=1 Tax=Thiorhodovibrio frisius TaxID=631362 RepID=H8Z375_9GAMM|nr:metalloregulator ArsR/SmtB family transcription factor [Thiorhodovibrio frisius]EIC21783.1 putative transcriptional regulator [Thiorhodovibrio frisius]WPL21750.1 Arsenical resistance operon repressor [Thiorhodovibrio frisius]